jgi:hypothetical protein
MAWSLEELEKSGRHRKQHYTDTRPAGDRTTPRGADQRKPERSGYRSFRAQNR